MKLTAQIVVLGGLGLEIPPSPPEDFVILGQKCRAGLLLRLHVLLGEGPELEFAVLLPSGSD